MEQYPNIGQIFALMPAPAYFLDSKGLCRDCNDTLINALGLQEKKEIIGKAITDWPVFYPQYSNLVQTLSDNNEKALLSSVFLEFEEKMPLVSGEMGIFKSYKIPIFNSKKALQGLLVLSFDVSAVKEETLLSKQAMLGFVRALAHDLKTPLSTVQIIAGFLAKVLPILVGHYEKTVKMDQDRQISCAAEMDEQQLKNVEKLPHNLLSVIKQADAQIDFAFKTIKGAMFDIKLIKKEDLVPCAMEEVIRHAIEAYPYEEDKKKIQVDTIESFNFMGNAIFMAHALQLIIKKSLEWIRHRNEGEVFISCKCGNSTNDLKVKNTGDLLKEGSLASSNQRVNDQEFRLLVEKVMEAFGGRVKIKQTKAAMEISLIFPKLVA